MVENTIEHNHPESKPVSAVDRLLYLIGKFPGITTGNSKLETELSGKEKKRKAEATSEFSVMMSRNDLFYFITF